MARERKSNPRKMRPLFLVLCEGETEENYVNFLRQNYRLPIKIVPKIIGSKITQEIIMRHKKEFDGSETSIKTFLMYDGDLPEVLENLQKCDGILLISKPCIEIWFIAHYKIPTEADITSTNCVKQLKSIKNWIVSSLVRNFVPEKSRKSIMLRQTEAPFEVLYLLLSFGQYQEYHSYYRILARVCYHDFFNFSTCNTG